MHGEVNVLNLHAEIPALQFIMLGKIELFITFYLSNTSYDGNLV